MDNDDCIGCKWLKEEPIDKWLDHYYCNRFSKYVGSDYQDLDYEGASITVTHTEPIESNCFEMEK